MANYNTGVNSDAMTTKLPLLRELSPEFAPAFAAAMRSAAADAQRWPSVLFTRASRTETVRGGPRIEDIVERHEPLAVNRLAVAIRQVVGPTVWAAESPFKRGYLRMHYAMATVARMS